MRQVIVTLFFCALPTITIVSGLTMAKTASSASGSAEDWTKEVLDLEKLVFVQKIAGRTSGMIQRGPKAGAPNHYMQYVYLKDESNNILAIQKFEHSDTAFPWVFPSSNFKELKH